MRQRKPDDPAKKLGAFLGKWETEGAFTSGQKTSTSLECRWSPQGSFLVCDQLVRMAGEHRQFTVYSYDSKTGKYSYTTLADPGAKPTTGRVAIKGNLWTYESSFEANGKTTMIRTTNEFTDAKTEVFKVASSDDGGAHWKNAPGRGGQGADQYRSDYSEQAGLRRPVCGYCSSHAFLTRSAGLQWGRDAKP